MNINFVLDPEGPKEKGFAQEIFPPKSCFLGSYPLEEGDFIVSEAQNLYLVVKRVHRADSSGHNLDFLLRRV